MPSTPPSLVKSACAGLLGEHRRVELEADERPGARGDVAEAGARSAGTPTTAEAVSCEPTATTGTSGATPRSAATSGSSGPTTEPASRSGGRIDQGSSSRLARSLRPLAGADVEQPGRRGVGALGADLAGQPVAEQVGQQEHGVGRLQRRGAAGGGELVDGVERQLLQAVDGVQLLHADRLGDQLGHVVGCAGRGGCRGCRAARRRGRAGRSPPPRSRCRSRAARPVRATSAMPASTSRWMPSTSQKQRAADRARRRWGSGAPPSASRCRRTDARGHHPAAGRPEVDGRDAQRSSQAASSQERRRHARVDGDVQPGGVGQLGRCRGRRRRWRCCPAAPRA